MTETPSPALQAAPAPDSHDLAARVSLTALAALLVLGLLGGMQRVRDRTEAYRVFQDFTHLSELTSTMILRHSIRPDPGGAMTVRVLRDGTVADRGLPSLEETGMLRNGLRGQDGNGRDYRIRLDSVAPDAIGVTVTRHGTPLSTGAMRLLERMVRCPATWQDQGACSEKIPEYGGLRLLAEDTAGGLPDGQLAVGYRFGFR